MQRLPGRANRRRISPPINLTIMTAIAPADQETTAADEQASVDAFDDIVDMAAVVSQPRHPGRPSADRRRRGQHARQGSERLASVADADEFVAVPAMPLDVSSAAAVDKGDRFARELGAGEDMLTAAVPTTPSRRNVWIATDPLSGAGRAGTARPRLPLPGDDRAALRRHRLQPTITGNRSLRRGRASRRRHASADRGRPPVGATSPSSRPTRSSRRRPPPNGPCEP